MGAAAKELEQGQWPLSLQLPLLILQLSQSVRHISPARQALQTWGWKGSGLKGSERRPGTSKSGWRHGLGLDTGCELTLSRGPLQISDDVEIAGALRTEGQQD